MTIFETIFSPLVKKAVHEQLAVAETENYFTVGARSASSDRDRFSYDRSEILEQSLEAWRTNPLARRVVELTSQYVVGGGLSITCKHKPGADFLNEFWEHRLNRMPVRVFEMCDELTRTGNLFIMLTTDPAGMSYIRIIPASDIEEIISRPNDIEQPLFFKLKSSIDDLQPAPLPAYDPLADTGSEPVILHYAVNRPAGAQWGEPDLAPLLRWLSRYSNWLEDRARLNRYRNAFVYVVYAKFANDAQRKARQMVLNANPPQPGSILVADESEEWKVINPRLDSGDAEKDGLALKKMISAGAGIPMHFLAEPESSTRTTAEASGGPTYRRFEQRQEFFLWLIHDLLTAIMKRRANIDKRLQADTEFSITGADISSRDNASLSQAAFYMISVLDDLRDRKLIDNEEFVRLIYRFFGESIDAEEMLAKAAKQKGEQGTLPQAKPDIPTQGNPTPKVLSPSKPSARAEGGDTFARVPSGHAAKAQNPTDPDPDTKVKDIAK